MLHAYRIWNSSPPFQKNFNGSLKPYSGFLHTNEQNPKAFKAFIKEKVRIELANQPRYGENPDVFYYQFTSADEYGFYLVRLCFYQNVDVFVSYMPVESKKPTHLGIELMNRGIKTIITLGGKGYEFN